MVCLPCRPDDFCKREAQEDGSVRSGRIAKKRGLSRHYPNKSQSFNCISDIVCLSPLGDSALVLSKSVSMRYTPMTRALSPTARTDGVTSCLRRINTVAAISDGTSEASSSSGSSGWVVLEEGLCSALEKTTLQDCTSDI
jgi:hypothetical protein